MNYQKISMSKVNRKPTEFDEKFLEQVALLTLACRNFDEGHEYASLHIAVSLRTFLIDSPKSILTHISKRTINFLDTSFPTMQDVDLGLLMKHFSTPWKDSTTPDVENYTISYTPFCHNIQQTPWDECFKDPIRWKTIDDWLIQPVCINTNYSNAKLNRLDLIKITADRDGGAHLDTKTQLN